MDIPVQTIEQKLGYTFKDERLLIEAFTHISYARHYGVKSNERLEYLGDAILQFVVTEWQYRKDADASEGRLTALRQKLVCRDALDSAVDGLDIWEHLRVFGMKYNVNGKAKSSLFEAVVAAIYLDGGYQEAKAFILERGNIQFDVVAGNPKGDLKEYLEKRGAKPPVYRTEQTGKDNAPIFHCDAYALGASAHGDGKTKKEAEATAATRLLWELENNPEQYK